MKVKHDGWVVVGPKGPIASTFGVTKDDCWAAGWNVVSEILGRTYCNKWSRSIAAAKRGGYTMQKVRLTPADGGLWR